ncbi:MAG TPA: ABC transporter ATP-binding protein [Caldilineaceae bacterium]|nr:ABC transporter ATP-binding protein [Caldilineaceae bacterium]
MEQVVLEAIGLTKRYDDFVAVDNLTLRITRGEVFGLLGPNGAGKTTTILMLMGLTEPSAGTVQVLGFDPARQPLSVKARVGYLPDQVGFYDNLSARENLIYIARLNGLSRSEGYRRIDANLERMGLSEAALRPVGTYSRGMRQRLGVAEMLLKEPQLVIMDEPTNGLDPEAARSFLQMIRDLRAEGITILLSSHQLHQVQAVCDRIGLFQSGRLVLVGTVAALAQQMLGGAYRIHLQAAGDPHLLEQSIRQVDDIVAVTRTETGYMVDARQDRRAAVARAVVQCGAQLLSLNMDTPSLDEIYTQYFHTTDEMVTN